MLNAVEDLGCDPTGETPCDPALENQLTNGTLVRFPPGSYKFERGHHVRNVDRLGLVGHGDVRFLPPRGFNGTLLGVVGNEVEFGGIDVDLRTTDTTAGLRFITNSSLFLDDVTFHGRGTHPEENVVNALALAIRDPTGTGLVRGVVARRGSAIGHYKGGDGRVGVWVGGEHQGDLTIEDCRFAEFGNNGIYASRTVGSVTVRGGVYRNNNVSGIRLGGGGNLIESARVEVDLDRYMGPMTGLDVEFNTRAIVLEQGPFSKEGSVTIRNCDIRIDRTRRSQGAVVVWPTGNGPTIEGSRLAIEEDGVPAVRAFAPLSRISPAHVPLTIRNSTIDGTARDRSAVRLIERHGSRIEQTNITQPGSNRDGVSLAGSHRCELVGTSISGSRYPVFAVARGTDTDRCLLVVDGDTNLTRTGPELNGLESSPVREVGATRTTRDGTSTPSSGPSCVEATLLETTDPDEGVGIVAIRDGRVYWRAQSREVSPTDE